MPIIQRTLKLKLQPTQEKAQILRNLQARHADGCNQVVQTVEVQNTTARTKIHHTVYGDLRGLGLPAQVACSAIAKGIEAYRSYQARKRSGRKACVPRFGPKAAVRFDYRCASIQPTKNGTGFGWWASLSTPGRCLRAPLIAGERDAAMLSEYAAGEWKFAIADLVQRGENFYLHVVLQQPSEVGRPEEARTRIGVDLGLNQLATVAAVPADHPRRKEDVLFFSGKPVQHRRRRFAVLRQELQEKKILSEVKERRDQECRWMTTLNHQISRQIVDFAARYERPVIVLENLTHIRERVRQQRKQNLLLHSWAFGQLQRFIVEKAQAAGIPVVFVDPAYTSQKCSRCGHVLKSQRNGRAFRCVQCGYQLHADLNAALNIAATYSG
jgi:IS605 OrfB family transposase